MANIVSIKNIPLNDLEVGKGQSRTRDVAKGIPELADSIRKMGQLEPIVVCPGSKPGKYEILTGQRRFLACKEIGKQEICAAVLDEHVDEITAKVISLTENLVRLDLNTKDLIDSCTFLYKKYGTIKAVCDETGLSYDRVSNFVKYDRLAPELKTLVDTGEVEVKTALRAQDALAAAGDVKPEEAVKLAKEMSGMSGIQQKKVLEGAQNAPNKSVDEVIESAKTGAKVTQVVVTLSDTVHRSLQTYASDEGTSQDDAAASLIEEGLTSKGFLEQ